jgi:hypothetical protein
MDAQGYAGGCEVSVMVLGLVFAFPLAGYLCLAYVPLAVGCMATVADGCAVLHYKLMQHACAG